MADNREEKVIDLLELARKLWNNKKFIIKVALISAIIGLIVAFSIPKEYTSSVSFTTKSNKSTSGNMGALASLAGINLNVQSSEDFSPELYPNIINSTSFVQGLLGMNVEDKSQKIDTTLYVYLKDKQKRAWWSYIFKTPGLLLSFFKSDQDKEHSGTMNPYFISNEEMQIVEALKNSYSITTNKKIGLTTFEVTLQSPSISAFLADTITSYLQLYIIQERTKKSQTDLENSYKLYKQYKEDYNKSQQRLASFIDRNKNIISEAYRSNQRKLELEANLTYDIYNQMAKQVQMDEIKVQDETPVFTIIQSPIEPLYPSKPNKKGIFIGVLFFGFIGACGWVLRKDIVNFSKNLLS